MKGRSNFTAIAIGSFRPEESCSTQRLVKLEQSVDPCKVQSSRVQSLPANTSRNAMTRTSFWPDDPLTSTSVELAGQPLVSEILQVSYLIKPDHSTI